MKFSPDTPVVDVVLDHVECAPVFQRHRIDHGCQDNMSIAEACGRRGIEVGSLIAELHAAVSQAHVPRAMDMRSLPTPVLIEHIISTYHGDLRRALPFVGSLAAKVARIHGDRAPKLRELETVVQTLREALEAHIDDEEKTLFPALASATGGDRASLAPAIEAARDDHDAVGGLLATMRELADDFVAPAWACTSYRALFTELARLELDTLRHELLEDHALLSRFDREEQLPAEIVQTNKGTTPGCTGGQLCRWLTDDHRRIESLLQAAVQSDAIDVACYQSFRAALLRHIGIEEKILLPAARRLRGGTPLPLAAALRADHAAIAALLVPTPTPSLLAELRAIVRTHGLLEEEPGGLYEQIERLAGGGVDALLAAARAAPEVPVAPHFDEPCAFESIDRLLRAAGRR